MLRCKNRTFNKFLFFSSVFFVISFLINTVVVYAVNEEQTQVVKKYESLRDCTSHIQIQQRQIIEQLQDVEKRL